MCMVDAAVESKSKVRQSFYLAESSEYDSVLK